MKRLAIIFLVILIVLPYSNVAPILTAQENKEENKSKSAKQDNDKDSPTHPQIYVNDQDKEKIWDKIENYDWAKEAYENIRYNKWYNFYDIEFQSVEHYADQHIDDPEWMLSRLAMYWKDGERYTQTYIKDQNFDYGEGNAPVPTVRMPGMRTWNDYINPPLEDMIPYNESGDMLAIDRENLDEGLVTVPYKETGHMVRYANRDIMETVERASFIYWLTGDEKFAEFASSVVWTWILGTYYMEPPLDPDESLGGPGGYEPGGISGYYDYEVIHDDVARLVATSYDFLYDYLIENPHPHLKELDIDVTDLFSTVFKRFLDIDFVRGNKEGNWNTNRWNILMNVVLALESDDYYEDGKGREHYLEYLTTKETDFTTPITGIMETYDSVTGLWPESPSYALGTINQIINWAVTLIQTETDIVQDVPILQKAATAFFPWMDPRGNTIILGDGRGGPADLEVLEGLLTYYTLTGDEENADIIGVTINNAIENGTYKDRGVVTEFSESSSNWVGLATFVGELPEKVSADEDQEMRTAYSEFHRHITMKNLNDIENGLMATLYGGRNDDHLNPQGLAMQLYGKGWALGVDSKAYESYWSSDYDYHSGAAGANTVLPGYTDGELVINGMEPAPAEEEFTNNQQISDNYSFSDVTADEKRRLVSIIRTSPTTGYYVDIFRSDQDDNDYIYHNLGNKFELSDASNTLLDVEDVDGFGETKYDNYDFFKNHRNVSYDEDFNGKWVIEESEESPQIVMDMWMKGQEGRTLFQVDAPSTTDLPNITPNGVNSSPETTPTLIVRQTDNNAADAPFISVFEPYEGNNKSIDKISDLSSEGSFVGVLVESNDLSMGLSGRKDYIVSSSDSNTYTPAEDLSFSGMYGVASENKQGFQSLYLGSGKMLQKGSYRIESTNDENVAAEIENKDEKFYYSADNEVNITLPISNTMEVEDDSQVSLYYISDDGMVVEVEGEVDSEVERVSGVLPMGHDSEIFIAESLNDALKQAKESIEDAVTGSEPGQYPKTAKDILEDAIVEAQNLLENEEIGQEEIEHGVQELRGAIETFKDSVHPDVDISELKKEIKKAEKQIENSTIGSNTGDIPESAIVSLQKVIDEANKLLNDGSVSQTEIDDMVNELRNAIGIFEDSKIKYPSDEKDDEDNEEKDVDVNEDNEENEDDTEVGSEPQDNNGETADNQLPKTSTSMYNWLLIGISLFIVGLTIAIRTNKKNKTTL